MSLCFPDISTDRQWQCDIQTCFSIPRMVLVPKKLHPKKVFSNIFPMYFFDLSKINKISPQAPNIEYFWNHSPHHGKALGITKPSTD